MLAPNSRLWLRSFVLAAVLFAAPALAQEGTPPPPAAPPPDSTVMPEAPVTTPTLTPTVAPPPAVIASDTTLTLPLVVELRPRSEINDDLTRSAELKATALRRVTAERAYETRRRSHVEIKKTEITSLKIRIDLAKKEKRTADQKDFEAQRRKLEAQQRYLERLRDLHGAVAEMQQALADYAQARIDEGRVELKLHDLGDLANPGVRAAVESRSAQARVLAAIRTRADRGAALASDERTAADRSKAVLDAYTGMIK
jgi:hypothetical protein